MTEWRPIEDFPTYSVSSGGRVRNDRTQRELSPLFVGNYIQVGLFRDGVKHKKYLSRLVAEAFVPDRSNRPNSTVIHLDGDLMNCAAVNLAWRPRWFAMKYTRQFRTLRDHKTPPIRNVTTGEVFDDVWELVMTRGLLLNDIKRSINEKTFVWPTLEVFEWAD